MKLVTKDSAGTVLCSLAYDYIDSLSGKSRLRQRVEDQDGKVTTYAYEYEPGSGQTGHQGGVDRLVSARTTSSTGALIRELRWTFDNASNRLTAAEETSSGTTTKTFRYNQANQLCWVVSGSSSNGCDTPPSGATTFRYDANGNETYASSGRSAGYDGFDRLTSLDGTALGYLSPTNGELVSYGSTGYHNDVLGLAREDSAGAVTDYTRAPGGELLAQRGSTGTEYVLRDALGSTVGLVSGGTVVRDYAYDPDGNASSTGSGATTNIRFAGGHVVGGLVHFGRRYYDPNIGRWTQPDPLQQVADLRQANRYVYVGGDPVNFTDPTGERYSYGGGSSGYWIACDQLDADLPGSCAGQFDGTLVDLVRDYVAEPIYIVGRCAWGLRRMNFTACRDDPDGFG